jgi:hypothetical protein
LSPQQLQELITLILARKHKSVGQIFKKPARIRKYTDTEIGQDYTQKNRCKTKTKLHASADSAPW